MRSKDPGQWETPEAMDALCRKKTGPAPGPADLLLLLVITLVLVATAIVEEADVSAHPVVNRERWLVGQVTELFDPARLPVITPPPIHLALPLIRAAPPSSPHLRGVR